MGMTKREKVLEGLTWAVNEQDVFDALYAYDIEGVLDTMKNAIELLKAQEPVKPNERKEGNYRNLYCGNCGRAEVGYVGNVTGKQYIASMYCPECGRAVKWDG